MTDGTKWAPGTAYGPVLSQTDLYLLNPKLELHPILTQSLNSFHLVFNLSNGQTGGYNADAVDRDLVFTAKDEVATLPRVTELVIITKASPWCTIVRNERGVSLADVCVRLWREYVDNSLTDAEFTALPLTHQDRVRRSAIRRETGHAMYGMRDTGFPIGRCKRIDLLRDKVFFDGLEHDPDFAKGKLGFAAPNIFKLNLMG